MFDYLSIFGGKTGGGGGGRPGTGGRASGGNGGGFTVGGRTVPGRAAPKGNGLGIANRGTTRGTPTARAESLNRRGNPRSRLGRGPNAR
jgi:hypothetical protein